MTMRYLGKLHGTGLLVQEGEISAPTEYELDGYMVRPGQITVAGEIRASSEALARSFGRKGLHLRTEDGRMLDLTFSDKILAPQARAANVDVAGNLPSVAEWRL
jgi:hypothetical protein